ncbi:MAG: OmpA family protein [candidate division Zixibacteria bacterium]|nr:OmpA family protein [candidate division Zixibacteria bacterium]
MSDTPEQTPGQPPPPKNTSPQTAPAPSATPPAPAPPVTSGDDDDGGGGGGWIVTFADMMSLLLCFFVLLLSFSAIDAEKFRQAAESMREALSFSGGAIETVEKPEGSISPNLRSKGSPNAGIDKDLERLKLAQQEIDDYIQNAGLADHVQTSIEGDRLKVVNSNPLNFPPGKAQLLESSQQYLDALLPVLQRFEFMIHVEGHTDDRPIETVQFKSNWELSAARAANFVRYLQDHGADPEHLVVIGYGPHRPIAPNDSDENRARNRRIEILLSPWSDSSAQAQAQLDELAE